MSNANDYTCEFVVENGILKKVKGRQKNINIPEEVKIIDSYAFKNQCGKKSIVMPDSVSKISNYAFSYCDSLENMEISSGIVSVGESCFSDSIIHNANNYADASYLGNSSNPYYMMLAITGANFKEIHKDTKITYHASIFFQQPDVLPFERFTKYDNGLYLGNSDNPYQWLVKTIDKNIQSCIVHKDTVIIGDSAFSECKNIEHLEIPENVYFIGQGAFYKCESLKNINLPNSLKCIPKVAFKWCGKLEKIAIPDTVLHIDDMAFWGCASLKEVCVPKDVLSIGHWSFGACHNLQKLTLPKNLTNPASYIVNSTAIKTTIIRS